MTSSGKPTSSIGRFFKSLFSKENGKGSKGTPDSSHTPKQAADPPLRSAKSFSHAPFASSPPQTPQSPSGSSHAQPDEHHAAAQREGNTTLVSPSSKSFSHSAFAKAGASNSSINGNGGSLSPAFTHLPQLLSESKIGVRLDSNDGPLSPVSRQPSKVFMELRAQAQVVPTKGNQLLAVAPNLPARMNRPQWTMKDYAIVEKMYKGYASTVYKAFCKRSGELVCLKAYDMANLCELNRFQIYREVQLHSRLQHTNIITLFGAFQQDNQVVMVQEFADGGDLFTLLHRYGGRLPERQAVEMVLQPFLNVLQYLHQQGILHRDLKPENILFTRTLGLKLCDFGLAIDLRDERAVTRAGTLEYMAPEVLKCPFKNKPEENKEANRYYYDISVDAWAVGVLIYELLVGVPPFNDKNRPAVEEKIRLDQPRFPSNMSQPARAFISWVLQKDPMQRPRIVEMSQHPFVRMYQKLAPVPAQKPKPRVALPSPQMSDELQEGVETMVRPKNMMQSFTAGKAPLISNKALTPEGRHMELPMQRMQNSLLQSNMAVMTVQENEPLTEEDAMADVTSTASTVRKVPTPPSMPPGMHLSRTASVPRMGMVPARPAPHVTNAPMQVMGN